MFETPHSSKPEKTNFGWELESKLERPPGAWSSFEMLAAATTKGMVSFQHPQNIHSNLIYTIWSIVMHVTVRPNTLKKRKTEICIQILVMVRVIID